jgi:hypothetical protein
MGTAWVTPEYPNTLVTRDSNPVEVQTQGVLGSFVEGGDVNVLDFCLDGTTDPLPLAPTIV